MLFRNRPRRPYGSSRSKIKRAGRIIVVGNRPVTVEAAKAYGATDVVDYKQGDIVAQILELTNNKGVDRTVIAGGNADIMAVAVKITAPEATSAMSITLAAVNTCPYHGRSGASAWLTKQSAAA